MNEAMKIGRLEAEQATLREASATRREGEKLSLARRLCNANSECEEILAAETGLPMTQAHIDNHAAHLKNWVRIMAADPMAIFCAAKDANLMATTCLALKSSERAWPLTKNGSAHCQVGQFRQVTSAITGHKLRVNTVADKFLVVSDTDFRKLPKLTASLMDWLTAGGSVHHGIARNIIEALRGFADVANVAGMCIAID